MKITYLTNMREHSAQTAKAPALQARAMDNLDFIRSTMERASAFTAVPGWGNVAIGCSALATAPIAARQATDLYFLLVWLTEATLALGLALWTMQRKARAHDISPFSGPGAKFFWCGLCPSLLAGFLLTVGLVKAGQFQLLPGSWLLLYGTGVITGGVHSIRLIPIMGIIFIGLGTIAFIEPTWNNVLLADGFGLCHIAFGLIIARKYGG